MVVSGCGGSHGGGEWPWGVVVGVVVGGGKWPWGVVVGRVVVVSSRGVSRWVAGWW
jgi:hypothetical protein